MDAPSTDERRIVDQWVRAGHALAEQRRRELRGMSRAEALKSAVALLDLLTLLPPPAEHGSGLIEQQRLFRRCA